MRKVGWTTTAAGGARPNATHQAATDSIGWRNFAVPSTRGAVACHCESSSPPAKPFDGVARARRHNVDPTSGERRSARCDECPVADRLRLGARRRIESWHRFTVLGIGPRRPSIVVPLLGAPLHAPSRSSKLFRVCSNARHSGWFEGFFLAVPIGWRRVCRRPRRSLSSRGSCRACGRELACRQRCFGLLGGFSEGGPQASHTRLMLGDDDRDRPDGN